jgi:hypothetical protein
MNQHIDLIYFFSSLVMVGLPLGIFCWLTYRLIKRWRWELREKGGARRT